MVLDSLSRWDGWSMLTKQEQPSKFFPEKYTKKIENIFNHKEPVRASKTFLKTYLDKYSKLKDNIMIVSHDEYKIKHESEFTGYKGKDFYDTGLIYAPYIPLDVGERERAANEKAAKDALGEELEGLTDL